MKKLPIVAIIACLTILSGCSAKGFLQATNTVLEVPACRQALVEYLPAEQNAMIADDLELMDESFEKLRKLVSGDAEITWQSAAKTAFGSLEKAAELEKAYANVQTVTREYRGDNEPDPYLVSCNEKVTRDWTAGKERLAANPNTAKAKEMLTMLAPLVIKVAVGAATGVPLI